MFYYQAACNLVSVQLIQLGNFLGILCDVWHQVKHVLHPQITWNNFIIKFKKKDVSDNHVFFLFVINKMDLTKYGYIHFFYNVRSGFKKSDAPLLPYDKKLVQQICD